jgi:hypothetical protein
MVNRPIRCIKFLQCGYIQFSVYLVLTTCAEMLKQFYRTFRWTAWGISLETWSWSNEMRNILLLKDSVGWSRVCLYTLNYEGVCVIVIEWSRTSELRSTYASVVLTGVGLVAYCLLSVRAHGMVRIWVLSSITFHVCELFQIWDFHFQHMCHLKCLHWFL